MKTKTSLTTNSMSRSLLRRGLLLILLIGMAGWATRGTSYADSIIGSPGAGFQSWTVSFNNLNTSSAPYWDYPTMYRGTNIFPPGFPPFVTSPPGQFANVGFCLTGTINCPPQFLNPGPPPGSIPFWGMPYDSATDTGGALDPNFFFVKDTPDALHATLEVQLSQSAIELNEFGWFETDAAGSFVGQLHPLFLGSGVPLGSVTPTPVGTTVTFIPTQFYGYYFLDVSEGGCLVATLRVDNFCITNFDPPHSIEAFSTDPGSPLATFWIAALNAPSECRGADCNLTLVKVEPTMADLSVDKTGSPDPVTVGNNLTYTVTVTNNGPDTATSVTVTDNLPLSTTFVSCSSTGDCSGSGNNRTVTFPSLASGESETITFVATVSCSVADPNISLSNGTVISNTATASSSTLDPDSSNNSKTVTTTLSNPPPTITGASVDKPVLWPPNHKLVNVTVNYNVTDNCPLSANSCTLSVKSNEPINGTGNGDTSPDWIILDAHHVQLRAERAGNGNGRIYTITTNCTDSGGNSSSQSVGVSVPHDRGRR
jgi:uncharacterized repeat protein (TIGR01451 family)